MKLTVTAKTGKKENKIIKKGEHSFEVLTKLPAKENKANGDIIRQLAEYFGVSKSAVFLVKGQSSKNKVFEIKS